MPLTSTASSTEVLAGLVDRVTFHKSENGFCVLRVKARGQRDLITVIGHAAMISAGEFIQASGSWVNDRTHGVQFRASFLKATAPTTVEGVEKYLGSGMIRGIGPVYAKKLVRALAIPCSRSSSRSPAGCVKSPLARRMGDNEALIAGSRLRIFVPTAERGVRVLVVNERFKSRNERAAIPAGSTRRTAAAP
jgi:hypothetical protein